MVASTAVRAAVCTALAAGVAAPVLRRRLSLPKSLVLTSAASAPMAARVLMAPSPRRDAAVAVLQMWAYLAAYEMPNDDPGALERRVRVDYPVRVDSAIGRGVIPTVRLQRALGRPGELRAVEKALIWTHWLWFAFPHASAFYVLCRDEKGFPRAAAEIYATFDVGLLGYWFLPTAPPWYAAKVGKLDAAGGAEMRRMMVEYGERFWTDRWPRLYGSLAGNPLAAMPSLHFATSVSAARVLARQGRLQGVVGWSYTAALGIALVYLGEHYVVDLLAGLGLSLGICAAAPIAAPLFDRVRCVLDELGAVAAG